MTKENNAPSIGSIELSFDPVGNRVRRIISEPVSNSSVLAAVLSETQMFGEVRGSTRSIVRTICEDKFLPEAEDTAICFRWGVEAVVGLNGRFDNHSFVYFTRNSESRRSVPEVIRQELGLLGNISEKEKPPGSKILSEAISEGFTFEILEKGVTDDDLERLVEMYKNSFTSYPFDIAASISGMIEDPKTHVYAARSINDGKLYAVSASELVTLPGSEFTMREMGDSAKMPGVNGLNAPLKLMLVAESFARDENIDLVFCESRAALGAVNSINHKIGMNYAGYLHKHTVISGPSDIPEVELDGQNGIYGNMNVWAFNQNQIEEIAIQTQRL